jgi:hypothetical protein
VRNDRKETLFRDRAPHHCFSPLASTSVVCSLVFVTKSTHYLDDLLEFNNTCRKEIQSQLAQKQKGHGQWYQ